MEEKEDKLNEYEESIIEENTEEENPNASRRRKKENNTRVDAYNDNINQKNTSSNKQNPETSNVSHESKTETEVPEPIRITIYPQSNLESKSQKQEQSPALAMKSQNIRIIKIEKLIHEPQFSQLPKVLIPLNSSYVYSPKNQYSDKVSLKILKFAFIKPYSLSIQINSSLPKVGKNPDSSKEELRLNPNFTKPQKISLYINSEVSSSKLSQPEPKDAEEHKTNSLSSNPGNSGGMTEEEPEFIIKLGKFLSNISSRGPNIIIYDENKTDIENSLSKIAVEIAEIISGKEFSPRLISSIPNTIYSTLPKLKDIGEGIFVLDHKLCEKIGKSNDDDNLDVLFDIVISAIIGDKFSIIIIPNCLYEIYQTKIGLKPSTIIKENFTKEEIQTLAYLASGLVPILEGYNSLSNIRLKYEEILNESWKWLQEKYIKLDVPSNQDPDENESLLHRKLKAVTIRDLIENRNIPPNLIKVEEEIDENVMTDPYSIKGLRPDIYVYTTREIYDAKTSYGKLPSDELYELQKKYSKVSSNIFAVMRPLPALLNFKAIKARIKSAKEESINLSVLIPVKENDKVELIDLFALIKKGKEYYESLNKNNF
ncbi:hypothetical protein V6M85_08230 [Sulfolobus tengchongensis]|uniref:Uncharacterized protein n=1 Tax=Sulfolobus tengchongensis TaxID=207809 RepID=A0AAX4KXD9_9CREN